MRNKIHYKKGFTLLELIIVVFIVALTFAGVSALGRNIFYFNGVIQNNANAEFEIRQAFKSMTQEVRSMGVSNEGSYPLVAAASSSITFYYDLNSNGSMDRIRYYLSGNTIVKGITTPTGNPLTFSSVTEATTTVVRNVYNGSTGVFSYYDTSYTGTSSALTFPVTASSVRLVKINLLINPNPKKSSTVTTYTTQVSLRNLKDNL